MRGKIKKHRDEGQGDEFKGRSLDKSPKSSRAKSRVRRKENHKKSNEEESAENSESGSVRHRRRHSSSDSGESSCPSSNSRHRSHRSRVRKSRRRNPSTEGKPRHSHRSLKVRRGSLSPEGKPLLQNISSEQEKELKKKHSPIVQGCSLGGSPIPEIKKEAPNYEPSGALVAERNTYNGIVLKYNEPREAKIPTRRYRLYTFKGDKQIDMLHIHRHSAYLLGRERRVADIPTDHPSCSSQHAVLQYRNILRGQEEDGMFIYEVIPYIIDLESTNGTYLNSEKIEPAKYYELKSGDCLKFGFSTREHIIMAEDVV